MKDRIKKLRKELNLTQREFSEQIGSSQNIVANYEIGRRNPSNSVINNICKTFNVSEKWLRTGEGEMFEQVSESDQLSEAVADLMKGLTLEDKKVQQLLINYFQMSSDSKKLLFDLAEKLFNGVDDSEEKSSLIDWSDVPSTPEELERRYPPVDLHRKKEIG